MKFFKPLFTLIAFSVLFFSCSSDDDNNSGNEQLANEQNQLEEADVPIANLNSDISVVGATKNQGTPPAPNSNLNLEISSDKAEAFQNSGFNLKFSTTETNIAGAYLLFKDSDNNNASDYFDIPVSEFNTNKSSDTKNKSRGPLKSSKTLIDGEYEIDVDFGDSFPPGKFCADLCIYDEQENISQIVTVCVEVEAWGGNAAIVGEWVLEESTDDDKYEVTCENQQTIEVDYSMIIKDEVILNIESNGDFYIKEYEEYKAINTEATGADCTATYFDEIKKYDDKETGKWAYNETDKTLTLVSFKYEDFIDPKYSEDYPNGDLILESGEVKFVDGKLVITDTYTEAGQTYTDVFTFTRK
ncbi:hypothetical protein Q4Q39_18720 [Flavivirga amylovorans]|uniref:Lipocalin-like domain-containing protein n=1 Tax=Flavivirga amylovorans TaxID=870486 RepID=A0ABT8X619_9FLAO|nr:hypothetical protein [Flavivirga amylovorans]MDO5989443.1 hypothetical protein [Flavivirga amylovorans]